MAENISFRSSMNGFNRCDVMSYIDKILTEKAELALQISNLERQLADVKSECDEKVNSYKDTVLNSALNNEATISRLENEVSALKAEADELKNTISKLNEKEAQQGDSLAAERAKLLEKEAQLNAELEKVNARAVELEKQQNDKCSYCDVAKVYEARLGAAMLDAKRFSEILVKEANDKASALFDDAFSSAQLTSEKAGAIAQSITEISNQFNVSFKVLLDNMKVLGKTLDSFKTDIRITGEKFDFTTEFEAFAGIDKVTAVEDEFVKEDIIPLRKIDVNFDDADEFDFRVDVND